MIEFIFLIILVAFSITTHEYAHGLVAYHLGDPTPKTSGRLSINPLAHIDIFGTLILPLLIIIISWGRLPPVGYAKPVPINPYNFKNPRKDILMVAAAGPLSNLLIAVILSPFLHIPLPPFLANIIQYTVIINILLCIFNIIPIPPLDGSRIIASFLPYKYAHLYMRMERFGMIIIILLFSLGLLQKIILPAMQLILAVMGIQVELG